MNDIIIIHCSMIYGDFVVVVVGFVQIAFILNAQEISIAALRLPDQIDNNK